jgi:hypothetical protein
MNSWAKLIATLVASGLVGFAIMVLLVHSGMSAESRDRTGPGLDEVGAFPICSVWSVADACRHGDRTERRR